jgi:two-component system, cell cycle response regulator DivK
MAGELVLIVEDNERNLRLVRDVLEFHGYEMAEARTAEAGVEIATHQSPQLILMDLQLPGADGFTALAQLRSDPETASIPVVALTAFAMTADRERCLSSGFDGYLQKPISIRDLPQQVAVFIAARGANRP